MDTLHVMAEAPMLWIEKVLKPRNTIFPQIDCTWSIIINPSNCAQTIQWRYLFFTSFRATGNCFIVVSKIG